MSIANQATAVELCRKIEAICPEYGCHVALTGGCLYKDESRKDIDILFYRIRQVESIDVDGLFAALQVFIGLEIQNDHGWVCKGKWRGIDIDCFFPEREGGSYSQNKESAKNEVAIACINSGANP